MKIFRYKEDRIPIAIFVGYFALDVYLFLTVTSLWFLILWYLIGIVPKACIAAWNHHHQHVPTFHVPILNRCLEVIYSFHTGISGYTWTLHHVVGHHLHYLDQTKDESRWKRLDGTRMGMIEYSLSVTTTAYSRAFQVGLRHKKFLFPFLMMGFFSLALLGVAFWYHWLNALFLFLLPMITALYFTAQATFQHHSGLETENEYEASHNILNPVYNLCTGNLGYHTAHHVKMGLHWSCLPQFHESIAHKIPHHLYIEPGFPWNFFPSSPTRPASASTAPSPNTPEMQHIEFDEVAFDQGPVRTPRNQ